jgi:hypothetical protein
MSFTKGLNAGHPGQNPAYRSGATANIQRDCGVRKLQL